MDAVAHGDYLAERLAEDMGRCPIAWYEPRPSARAFHLDCEHDTRFLFGGLQSCKTYSTSAENCMAMTGIESVHCPGALDKFHKPPIYVRHWCEDVKRVGQRVILPIYLKLIPKDMLAADKSADGTGYNKEQGTLHLTNGSWMQFMSYGMEKSKSESFTVDIVTLDEPPEETLYVSQRARIAARGGHITGGMTLQTERMGRDIGWIHRRIIRYGDGDNVEWWQVPSYENFEALIREAPTQKQKAAIRRAYESWVKALSPEQYGILIEGKGCWITGALYPEFDARTHSYDKASPAELVDLAKRGVGRIYAGLDHGLSHPTAMVWWFVAAHPVESLEIAEGDCIQYREYKIRGRRVPQHIEKLLALTGDEPLAKIYCDPHMDERDPRGGPTILKLYHDGFKHRNVPVIKANNAHDIGHAMMRNLLAPREGYPSWPRYRICEGTGKKTVEEFYAYNEETKLNDDLMDCVRYLAVSRPRAKPLKQLPRIPCDPTTGLPLTTILDVRRSVCRY